MYVFSVPIAIPRSAAIVSRLSPAAMRFNISSWRPFNLSAAEVMGANCELFELQAFDGFNNFAHAVEPTEGTLRSYYAPFHGVTFP
jgi:hypothetical protein